MRTEDQLATVFLFTLHFQFIVRNVVIICLWVNTCCVHWKSVKWLFHFCLEASSIIMLRYKLLCLSNRQGLLFWARSTMGNVGLAFLFFVAWLSCYLVCRCVFYRTKVREAEGEGVGLLKMIFGKYRTKLGNDTGMLRMWAERSKCWALFCVCACMLNAFVYESEWISLWVSASVCLFVGVSGYRLDQFNFWPFARAYAIHFTLNRHTLFRFFLWSVLSVFSVCRYFRRTAPTNWMSERERNERRVSGKENFHSDIIVRHTPTAPIHTHK